MEDKAPRQCSHGSEAFLNTFVDHLGNLPAGAVFINLQTLLRNLLSENIDGQHAVEMLGKEIRYIVSILAPHMKRNSGQHQPVIMFYMFDYYKMLPGYQFRPTTGARERIAKLVRFVVDAKDQSFKTGHVGTVDGVFIYSYSEDRPGLPEQFLFDWVGKHISTREICMVSHQVLDWHLHGYLEQLWLVNSFTGEQINSTGMANKAFGDAYHELPFHPGIHRLLGDKTLLAPMLTPKQKRELLEVAEKEDWKHHSATYVQKQLHDKYRV